VGWRIVARDALQTHDFATRALFEEGRAAAPDGFLSEDTIEMLPRRPLQGRCRLCGQDAKLTKEHIPPRASGNKNTGRSHSFDEWLSRLDLEQLPDGEHQQGGIFGYTLCRECNSYTGTHYGAEYQKWTAIGRATLEGLPHPLQLDQLAEPLGWNLTAGSKEAGGVLPGLFARQVLSCFCSLSGTWDLAERHPEIRHIILDQSPEPLPLGLELGLSLYVGPHARMAGPTLLVEPEAGEWRWLMEMAYPPFAFLLVMTSNINESGVGLMMNDWTTLDLKEPKSFEGIARIGFGWSAYPGDYRSRSAIAADRDSH
jgi:hypothetical protein